jgi:mono/diheme cytochrome c family protein
MIKTNSYRRRFLAAAGLILALTLGSLLAACGAPVAAAGPARQAGGNAQHGQQLIVQNGCGSCHMIPGISGANGLVGPPLLYWSRRGFIGGELENTPDNLIRWLKNPKAVEPGTDMPNLNLSDEDARDIATYLYTIH